MKKNPKFRNKKYLQCEVVCKSRTSGSHFLWRMADGAPCQAESNRAVCSHGTCQVDHLISHVFLMLRTVQDLYITTFQRKGSLKNVLFFKRGVAMINFYMFNFSYVDDAENLIPRKTCLDMKKPEGCLPIFQIKPLMCRNITIRKLVRLQNLRKGMSPICLFDFLSEIVVEQFLRTRFSESNEKSWIFQIQN